METGIAARVDKPKIMEMWRYCFGDDEQFVAWYFDNIYKEENTYCIKNHGEICANLQSLPYKLTYTHKSAAVNFVVGVASRPEGRGRGFVRQLMYYSLHEIYKKNLDISLLIPFNFDFYRKFGYEACSFLSVHKGSVRDLRKFSPYKKGEVFECYDTEHLNDIYTKFVQDKNLYFDIKWDEVIKPLKMEGGVCFALEDRGYILYKIKEGNIYVYEMVYNDVEALRRLLRFIYDHEAQVHSFSIRTAEDGILKSELAEKCISHHVVPHAMARVVNVENVLNALAQGFEGEVCLCIEDDILLENTGCYKVAKNSVERCLKKDAHMDIATFSALSLGAISEKEAQFRNKLQGSTHNLFSRKTNYINMIGWT